MKAAEARLGAARVEFNRIVVSIGIRVRNAGGQNAALIRHDMPDGRERDQAVGWVGTPPNPFSPSIVPHHAYGYSVGVQMYTDSEMHAHIR